MDMIQPGVEVRPLVEMTGHALFNEVFLSDARVADDAIIGGRNNGWAVANTTLMNERSGLGAGGGSAAGGMAAPGTKAGQLERRAGDFVSTPRRRGGGGGGGAFSASSKLLIDLAKGNGTSTDPGIRQDLVKLYTLGEIGRYGTLRMKAMKKAGKDIPGMGNIAKLSMSDMMRLSRDLSLRIVGADGMLHAYKDEDRAAIDEATGNPFIAMVTGMALWAQGPPIYGGTDQIQRNIIGERVLGLPKEPNNDKVVPFSDLPKNA
jgi:alkylation response protein AidB-like acyl-CoA dehydrogenase